MLTSESLFTPPFEDGSVVHVKRFYTNPDGDPVLLVHGSIENSRIFWSKSGKGLAPWLAEQGYDVFAVDTRGHGASKPKISRATNWGLDDVFLGDFPACLDLIAGLKGPDANVHCMAHSWGGVLWLAFFARHEYRDRVRSFVFFGSKRRITVHNWQRYVYAILFWGLIGSFAAWIKGYLPAVALRLGSDNETRKTNSQTNRWVQKTAWTDPDDEFDYSAALKNMKLPPVLSMTGVKDKFLGHPKDVKLLLEESGIALDAYKLIGRSEGNLHDYGHIDLLTHKEAGKDVFVIVDAFLKAIA